METWTTCGPIPGGFILTHTQMKTTHFEGLGKKNAYVGVFVSKKGPYCGPKKNQPNVLSYRFPPKSCKSSPDTVDRQSPALGMDETL